MQVEEGAAKPTALTRAAVVYEGSRISRVRAPGLARSKNPSRATRTQTQVDGRMEVAQTLAGAAQKSGWVVVVGMTTKVGRRTEDGCQTPPACSKQTIRMSSCRRSSIEGGATGGKGAKRR